MRRFWHPFVPEIQLIKTKLFKETNSADSLIRSIRRSCKLHDFMKMVECWQWMAFCERGSRKYKINFYFAAFTFKTRLVGRNVRFAWPPYTPKQGVCTVCFFKKLSFDELYFRYERVPKSPYFLCSLKKTRTIFRTVCR